MQNQERETPKDPARAGTYGARRERERESKSHSQKITKTVILAIIFIAGLFLLSQYSGKIWAAVIFQDDTQAEFESGVYSHNETQWDATNSWLELTATGLTNGSGDYTSDIKDAGVSTTWTTISWIPERPTGKELPNSGNSETAYNSGNANMSNNILLMHMNDNAGSTAVVDSSASGNNGTFNDAGGDPNTSAHSTTTAKFGTALEFDGIDDYIYGDGTGALNGLDNATFSIWTKRIGDGSNAHETIIQEGAAGSGYVLASNCNNDNTLQFGVRTGGTSYLATTSNSIITDGEWHHLAGVYDGDSNIVYIYVDGIEKDNSPADVDVSDPGVGLSIGSSNLSNPGNVCDGTNTEAPFNGAIDEVAIYSRALNSTEIADLYKRGVLKLKNQVRSCDDSACSGETFIGPDGTASDYYEWATSTLATTTPSFTLTNVSDNHYFQYKTYFETATSTFSPELKSVSTSGTTINSPPNTPTNSLPANGATNQNYLNLALSASAYSDSESDSHMDTGWQVDNDSDFSSPVWTSTAGSAETSTAINPANGTFANELSGRTGLASSTTYYWQVRYSDGSWSSWSTYTSFTTQSGTYSFYFDATDGSDSNHCASSAQACQTISNLNTLTINAGETVYLKRGETWYEELTVGSSGASGNPITFDAYDTGNLPVISGEAFINDVWTLDSGEYKYNLGSIPYVVFYNSTTQLNSQNEQILSATITDEGSNLYSLLSYYEVKAVYDSAGGWTKLTEVDPCNAVPPTTLNNGEWCVDYDTTHSDAYASNSTAKDWKVFIKDTGGKPADDEILVSSTNHGELAEGEAHYNYETGFVYVRLSGDAVPSSGEISYLARANNIVISNQSNVTIQNVQLDKSYDAGIYLNNTANQTGLVIDDIKMYRHGQYAVNLNTSSGVTTSMTITDSIFQHVDMRFNQYAMTGYGRPSVLKLGTIGTSGDFTGTISGNLIDANVSGGGEENGAGDINRQGMIVVQPNNVTIENNEITRVDHGIDVTYGTGATPNCAGVSIKYNYIHDIADDFIWGDFCGNTDPLQFIVRGNILNGNGDDGVDLWATAGLVVHNYIAGFYNNGIWIHGDNTYSDSLVYNNIVVRDGGTCNASGLNEGCFVGFNDDMAAGSAAIFNRNLYYDTSGTYGNVFKYNPGSWTSVDFSTWQALTDTPDTNSVYSSDPLIVSTSTQNFNLQATSPAIDAGIDLNFTRDYASSTIPYDMPSIANTGSAGSYSYDYVDIGAYEYVTPPDTTLQCTTHPSESTWYTDVSTVSISFASPYDTLAKATTTDFRYLVNQTQSPASTTIQTATLLDDAITFDPASSITSDGTWYIHALGQNESNTSTYSANYDTYTINYDATNPTVSLSSPAGGFSTTESQPTMSWSGSDSASGIAKYQLYIDGALDTDNISGASAAPSSALSCGSHTWYVKAVDNAGNSTNSSTFNLTRSCGGGIPIQLLQQINDARRAKQNADAGKEESKPINEEPEKEEAEEVESKIHSSIIEEYRVEAAAIFKADVDSIVSTVNKERDIDLEIDVINGYLTEIGAVAESREEAAGAYWQLMIVNFITYGTPSTLILGAGERAGAVNSYKSAFNKLPKTENEWLDAIKIANGRWPNERNEEAEERARTNFEIVYLRQPDRSDPHDDAAITVMAYGLRPSNRNMDSEKAAIKIFRDIYGYNPEKATAWDVVRAIAYSGATR